MSEVKEKVAVRVADVLDMLQNGKTREEIRVHYNVSKKALAAMFKHPELKGRRTIVQAESEFEFVEDTADTIKTIVEKIL